MEHGGHQRALVATSAPQIATAVVVAAPRASPIARPMSADRGSRKPAPNVYASRLASATPSAPAIAAIGCPAFGLSVSRASVSQVVKARAALASTPYMRDAAAIAIADAVRRAGARFSTS